MGAITIYKMNALIYRPAEGGAETALLEAACQHLVNDEDGTTYPSLYQRGAYFLSDVMQGEAYHLPETRRLDSGTLERLYRRDCMADIAAEFYIPQKGRKRKRTETRATRKRKTTTGIARSTHDSDSSQDSGLEGVRPDEANDIGVTHCLTSVPNTEASSHAGGIAVSSEERNELLVIMRQFPSDILQLAPSPRSGHDDSWLLLSSAERCQANVDIFKAHRFEEIFRQAQYKVLNEGEWYCLVFHRYFPPKGETNVQGLQNFPLAQYYRRWHLLLEQVDKPHSETLREIIFKWFDRLHWLPHPEVDRMWYTKKAGSKKTWVMVPEGELQNCPRLAVNPRHWNVRSGAGSSGELDLNTSM